MEARFSQLPVIVPHEGLGAGRTERRPATPGRVIVPHEGLGALARGGRRVPGGG